MPLVRQQHKAVFGYLSGLLNLSGRTGRFAVSPCALRSTPGNSLVCAAAQPRQPPAAPI
jgi:hypothetical protein